MRIVLAEGSARYGSVDEEFGSKRKGMVPSRRVVDVAAWEIRREVSSGRRNVDVQPVHVSEEEERPPGWIIVYRHRGPEVRRALETF